MRNKLWAVIPLALASLAMAQNLGVVGAKGEGATRSEDGRAAKFNFDVKKVFRPNGSFEVGGRLRFETVKNDRDARHVLIEMQAREFGRNENIAEFAGPGVIVVRSGREVVRKEGRVSVRVVDNKRPNVNEGRPDQFGIRFNVANSDAFYNFVGPVLRGDLVVYARPRD